MGTIDTNRQLGSTQTDAGRNLAGVLGGTHRGVNTLNHVTGPFTHSTTMTGSFHGSSATNTDFRGTNMDASRVWGEAHTTGQRVDGTDLPDPNPEFRPRNVPMIPIIKYK